MKSQLLLLLPPPTPLLFALRQFNTKKKKLGIQNRLQLVFRIFADSSHPAPASHTNSPDRDRSAFPTNRVEKNWLSLELFRLFPPPPPLYLCASLLSLSPSPPYRPTTWWLVQKRKEEKDEKIWQKDDGDYGVPLPAGPRPRLYTLTRASSTHTHMYWKHYV